jgi:putative ABC transport system substrate-binding protein
MAHLGRRAFIRLLGGAAAVWPLEARAQRPATPVIGFLNGGPPDIKRVAAFGQGLNETGYIEGLNVAIEYHWAEGRYERLAAMAADLVRRRVTVIAATTTPAAIAAKAATTTIPIVFTTGSDPVQLGLVASLSRPGGNLTGATTMQNEVSPKRLQILHEVMPTAKVFALLVNPANPYTENLSRSVQEAARILGLQLHILHASNEHDLERAFVSLSQLRSAGLVIGGAEVLFDSWSAQLATFTIRFEIPTIYQGRAFVVAGGLMSYGGSVIESYRVAGSYAGRILMAEKPSDLPVQQATRMEFLINVKAAKTLGLSVPLTLLAGADEVIE